MVMDHIAALRASPNKLYARLVMRMGCGRIKFVGQLPREIECEVLELAPALPKRDDDVGQDVMCEVRLRKRGQEDFVVTGPAQHEVLSKILRLAVGFEAPRATQ